MWIQAITVTTGLVDTVIKRSRRDETFGAAAETNALNVVREREHAHKLAPAEELAATA